MERQDSVQRFLELIRRSHRGKFKVYIGMSAGVGKTCRMLQEARQLLDAGVDVRIGYIETHGRAGTEALVEGLPLVPRRRLFYKGKELEEMDTQAIVNLRPEIVVVDELAHTNIEGSENPKRWQDVMQILDAGISVISAVNIQHIEGLNEVVEEITGIEIRERVPDSVLAMADEVVNIDLTAVILAARLRFRPIVMTSLAFILGMLPLVFASGPGSASRQGIGTGVFFGMLVAITVGIVFVPLFFVWVYKLKEKWTTR